VTASESASRYLREKAVTSTQPDHGREAAAALKVIEFADSAAGRERLKHVAELTKQFENGLKKLGFEIIESPHPIVPLMVRDTEKTTAIVKFLFENGILATGLNYPVVPKGDQTIRFQINGNHTPFDIDSVLSVLAEFKKKHG
jgi:glycine C-acetyltransferase